MLNENANKGHREGHQTLLTKHPRRVPNILIVDDDVDSALNMDSMFRPLGCNVEIALDPNEAQRKISSGKADVIVLDWLLDTRTSADQVVARAIHLLEKFGTPHHLARIITFSSLNASEVKLPFSPYYVHADHWQKPLRRPELTRKTQSLLSTLGV